MWTWRRTTTRRRTRRPPPWGNKMVPTPKASKSSALMRLPGCRRRTTKKWEEVLAPLEMMVSMSRARTMVRNKPWPTSSRTLRKKMSHVRAAAPQRKVHHPSAPQEQRLLVAARPEAQPPGANQNSNRIPVPNHQLKGSEVDQPVGELPQPPRHLNLAAATLPLASPPSSAVKKNNSTRCSSSSSSNKNKKCWQPNSRKKRLKRLNRSS